MRACCGGIFAYVYKKERKSEGRRSATDGMSTGWRLVAELLGGAFSARPPRKLTGLTLCTGIHSRGVYNERYRRRIASNQRCIKSRIKKRSVKATKGSTTKVTDDSE